MENKERERNTQDIKKIIELCRGADNQLDAFIAGMAVGASGVQEFQKAIAQQGA